ncbi:MAG: hypothetical protein WC578_00750 [Candidatus Omnitrophota bacterium]|jgi:hypothetical protein
MDEDKLCIERFLEGDEKAFEALIRKCFCPTGNERAGENVSHRNPEVIRLAVGHLKA